ncbi:MAG: hypothetical protein KC776_39195, partial [Myxococcales bacterium]|nr:hypothetical protein [Myxococcales bacterium]
MRARVVLACLFSVSLAAVSFVGCAGGGDASTTGTGGSGNTSGTGGTDGGSGTGGSGNTSGTGGSGGTGATGGTGGGAGMDGGAGDASLGGAAGMAGGAGMAGMAGVGGAAGMAGAGGTDGGACSTGCPANMWDIDNNPLTGTCGCEYSCVKKGNADPIDPNYEDDNCDGGDGLVEQCVYVSTSQGSDATGDGTRNKPLATIAAAIAHAKSFGVPAVCLSGEQYNENVTVESGISVYGGFDQNDANFKFRRSASATTIVQAQGTVFHVPTIAVDTHIEGLT